jgi:hypothetical protein
MSVQDHTRLLAALVRQDWQTARRHASAAAFDFGAFEDFIFRNQLGGWLYSVLVRSPAAESFARYSISRLESAYLRQRTRNAVLVNELKRLLELFSAAGEQFILLKGVYLAERFYGAIDRRALWDIDILVRKERLRQVQKLLRDDGYIRKSRPFLREDLSSYFTHAFDFDKNGISLDLHWSLSTHASYRLDYDALWGRRQPFRIEGCDFQVLADDYEIVFNVLSTLRDLERSALRLRSLVDLYMILEGTGGPPDWQIFFAERKRENLWKISVGVLWFFLSVLHCRAEFPLLAHAVEHERATVGFNCQEPGPRLLEPSRWGLRQKAWASRLYHTSFAGFFLWWMISLPFRLSVYKPGKVSRLTKAVVRWTAKPFSRPTQ